MVTILLLCLGQIFHEKIPDAPYTEDVAELTAIARKTLRQKFYQADVGLSGVNFAVAETGTLCLVENEGNGRLCTTVPKVHIALMGLEKVVEKLEDLPPLLRLLIGSATGQLITTYVNMISSPRRSGEKDGPKEVHLVAGRVADLHSVEELGPLVHPDVSEEDMQCAVRATELMNRSLEEDGLR